jgi:pseudoazurin
LRCSYQALGDEIEVKSRNRSSTGFFVFPAVFVRIKSGGAINFVAAEKGHEVHSVPDMIPEGTQPFDAEMSQDIKAMFTVPRVCVIACKPHTAMGMVGVVVVGEPINIDKIDPSTLPGMARIKLDTCSHRSRKVERWPKGQPQPVDGRMSQDNPVWASDACPGHRG